MPFKYLLEKREEYNMEPNLYHYLSLQLIAGVGI
jgi:hypothetical protein